MPPRRTFGATWWGKAWIDALEHRARLDPNRLPRGRTYARQDRVHGVTLATGEVRAHVAGSRRTPYVVRVRIRTFTPDEWERVLDAIASRAAHAAALLDGELEPGIVEDARAARVELLPDAGEVQPRCSCPDWADPCKHAAAVCYLVADELDADPFRLLELRGRSRDEVLAALRRRRAEAAGGAGTVGGGAGVAAAVALPPPDAGVPAAALWSAAATPSAVRRRAGGDGEPGDGEPLGGTRFPAPPLPAHPGRPAPWPTDPPAEAPFTAAGLVTLAADAAERAWRQLGGEGGAALDLDEDADLARRAAALLGTGEVAGLARAAGRTGPSLAGMGIAWRQAGPAGLRVLSEPKWRPPPAAMAAARDAVVTAGTRSVAVDGNRLVLDGAAVQLRLSRDGRWYRFTRRSGRWDLDAPPADEPDELLPAGDASGSDGP